MTTLRTLPKIPPSERDSDFTEELQKAVHAFPNGKAPGRDGIPYEAYKVLVKRKPVSKALLARYNSLLRADRRLTHIEAQAIGIPKPNGKIRPLSLLPSEHKILERLCLNRARPMLDFAKSQSGFRRGMSCLRPLLTLLTVIGSALFSASSL